MFGPRIKHFRKMLHMSQQALADKLHVTQGAITCWENEQRSPDIETIIKLCKIFGVTTDMLLGTELDENGTRLLLSAAPVVELSHELEPEQLSQWLAFGKWLSSQNKSNATTQTNLSSSDNDS